MKKNKKNSFSPEEKSIILHLSHKHLIEIKNSLQKELNCKNIYTYILFESIILTMLVSFWTTTIEDEEMLKNFENSFSKIKEYLEDFLKRKSRK